MSHYSRHKIRSISTHLLRGCGAGDVCQECHALTVFGGPTKRFTLLPDRYGLTGKFDSEFLLQLHPLRLNCTTVQDGCDHIGQGIEDIRRRIRNSIRLRIESLFEDLHRIFQCSGFPRRNRLQIHLIQFPLNIVCGDVSWSELLLCRFGGLLTGDSGFKGILALQDS